MTTPEENNHQGIDEFLKSIQNDSQNPAQNGATFPFAEDFDMDAYGAPTDSLEQTLTSIKSASGQDGQPGQDFSSVFESDSKDRTIRNLEDKIAALEMRFEDASQANAAAAPYGLDVDDKEDNRYTPSVKANDEFYKNISSTIETLKGSLENIVSARLEYEENLIRQDATLITRLRDKTTRLKAINLALNSEVKRAKNEKLESLRRSAEQTKELLSLRMQLSKVEEKARQGDYKLANLEQQIAFISTQKAALDEEILSIREEKLNSLRHGAEQTKEIMNLRLELGKTEDKFKHQELQTGYLKEQLASAEAQRAAMGNELYATRSQREEAGRKAAELERQAEALRHDIIRAQEALDLEAKTAQDLRAKIIAYETDLQRLSGEKAVALHANDEALRRLEAQKQEHEREMARLQAAQVQEIELLKSQKAQEAQTITLELQRAEDKYRQEETFVNTLKLQIESLRADIDSLDGEKAQLKGKSADLAREIDFIKENHKTEIENLNRELKNAQEKFEREQNAYQALNAQLAAATEQKNNLSREIAQILAAKDDALRQNDDYIAQIRRIKDEHATLAEQLKQSASETQNVKSQLAALTTARELIESELKKANEERYDILKQLEDKTKEFETYRASYEAELAALQQGNARQAMDYRQKLQEAADRYTKEQALVADLKTKITALETEKLNLAAKPAEGTPLAAQLSAQTQEIINLKTQLSKAESRFLQDTVLINQLKEQFTIAGTKAQTLEAELQILRADAARAKQGLAAKEAELESLKSTLSKTQDQLRREEEAVRQLQEHTEKLKAVNTALDSEVKKVQAEKLTVLEKSAQQANEILALKEQLLQAESGLKNFDFENGIISLRKEYEGKIETLETQLNDVSARFAEQVREIDNLKADNTRLQAAEQEKQKIETQYKALAEKALAMEERLKTATAAGAPDAGTVKMAAVTAQLAKIKRDKAALEERLAQMQTQMEAMTKTEQEKAQVLSELKTKVGANDALIARLKQDIVVLTRENVNLKAGAPVNRPLPPGQEATLRAIPPMPPTLRVPAPPAPSAAPVAQQPAADPQPQPKPDAHAAAVARHKAGRAASVVSPGATMFTTLSGAQPIAPKPSVLDFDEKPEEAQEITELPGDSLDISMIFKDEEASALQQAAPAAPTPPAAPTAQEHLGDHSPRQQRLRPPASPQNARDEAAYSDFLKKTQSVFYRIQWSLFKEDE